MKPRPPSALRVQWLLLRLSLLRFGNWVTTPRRRPATSHGPGPTRRRAATARKGSRRGLVLLPLLGLVLLFNSLNVGNRALGQVASAASTATAAPPAGVETTAAFAFDWWPDPAARPTFDRAVAGLLCLLCLALVCTALAMGNQDLGKVEWHLEWLFTLPAPTIGLLGATLMGYAVLNLFSWFTVLPLLLLYAFGSGLGWLALPIALLATLGINLLIAGVRLLAETWLRLHLAPRHIKSVQAGATVLGVLGLGAALYPGLVRGESALLVDVVAAVPAAVEWSPVYAIRADLPLPWTAAFVGFAVLFAAGCAALTARQLRYGLTAGGGIYAATSRRSRPAEGRHVGRRRPFGRFAGKEWRLLLRDRAFAVQTLLVPIFMLGIQLVANPDIFGAASEDPRHACMLAFGVAAYLLIIGGASIVASEAKAIWFLYVFPIGIADSLRDKAEVWGRVALVYALATLVAIGLAGGLRAEDLGLEHATLVLTVLAGVWIYTYIAAGIAILGADPLAMDARRRVRTAPVLVFLLLASFFALAVYGPHWSDRVAVLVLTGLFAVAIWQQVTDRAPFLLDPTASPPAKLRLTDGLAAALVCLGIQALIVLFMRIDSGPGAFGFDTGSPEVFNTAVRLDEYPKLSASPPAERVAIAWALAAAVTVTLLQVITSMRGIHGLSRLWALAPLGRGAPPPLRSIALGVLGGGAAGGAAILLTPKATAISLDGWTVVLALLAAPILEEFLFRGVIFRCMRDTFGRLRAVLLSAAAFTVVHPVGSWPPLFVLGVVTALVFERTQLLWAAIATHLVYRAMLVIAI